jgi:two-component system nitrogen regulation response regulator NtrX
MSLSTQAKVLRVLQEMKFERIGGEKSISVDVRVIAATNKHIQEEIRSGRFREDLYFRINVIPIFVPPLRDRIEDLVELVDYFMGKYRGSSDESPRRFSEDSLQLLRTYSWPGNIRELKNFIERINIMNEEKVISADAVRRFLTSRTDWEKDEVLKGFESMKLNEAKDEFEREFLVKKLEENEQSISRTSRALGITPSHLHNKIKKHGIEINK